MKKEIDKIKQAMTQKEPPPTIIRREDFVSTSSTLLDLGCTGKIGCGLKKGHFYLFVGDSNSGKTWFTHAIMAEASINKNFDGYQIVSDIPEGGALFNVQKFFGSKLANRIQPPKRIGGVDTHSTTLEEFYDYVTDYIKKPTIYMLDSENVLTCEAELKKYTKSRNTRNKIKEGADEQVSGSMSDGKAKVHSANLRRIIPMLAKTDSILIIVSQTKDIIPKPGQFMFPGADTKTRSGGHALSFYATMELWFSIKERTKKLIRGKQRQIGIVSKIRVKRSRTTGKDRTVEVPILHGTGVDDVGSCVDYLINEKHWKAEKGKGLGAPEFDFTGNREELVRLIEEMDSEKELKKLVKTVWDDIEKESVLPRKNRYE